MKAVIIIDMQDDFLTGPLGNQETAAITEVVVQKLKEYANEDTYLYFTRDTHYDNYLNTQEGKNLPIQHCKYMSQGWHVSTKLTGLKELSTYRIADNCYSPRGKVDKNTFGSINLCHSLMTIPNLEQIVLMGVCTDICVISNALTIKSFFPEVEIIVDAAGCAGTTPENHANALRAMRQCQIKVIND